MWLTKDQADAGLQLKAVHSNKKGAFQLLFAFCLKISAAQNFSATFTEASTLLAST